MALALEKFLVQLGPGQGDRTIAVWSKGCKGHIVGWSRKAYPEEDLLGSWRERERKTERRANTKVRDEVRAA